MLLHLLVLVPLLTVNTKSLAADEKNAECSYKTEGYSLSWKFDEPSSDVVFKIVARSALKNFWAGFLLGNDDQPRDSIGAFVRNGQIGLLDGYAFGGRIALDNTTNVQALLFDLQDDVLTAEFARPVSSNDPTDADLTECVTFFLPKQAMEVDLDGQIKVPQDLHKKRVCNIPTMCKEQTSDLVKRSDASVCEHAQGDNTVSWKKVGGDVMFSVGQSIKAGKWWTAVGVGQSMSDLKMAIAFLENGELKSLGGFHTEGYGTPIPDPNVVPKLETVGTRVNSDRSYVQFSLPMEVFQNMMDNSGCVTLQIAALAGEWTEGFVVKKHQNTPEAVLVCGIDQCLDVQGNAVSRNGANAAASSLNVDQTATTVVAPEPSAATAIGEEPASGVTVQEAVLNGAGAVGAAAQPQGTTIEQILGTATTLSPENAPEVIPSVGGEAAGNGEGHGSSSDQNSAAATAPMSNEIESSGVEPAKDSSLFGSAARAVDSIAEGSGSEASGIASGEQAKTEGAQETELLNAAAGQSGEGEEGSGEIATPKQSPSEGESPLLDAHASGVTPEGISASGEAAPPSMTTSVGEQPILTSGLAEGQVGKPLVLSKAVGPAVSQILRDGCADGHTDLRVCESYFADYLGKVQDWANKHNQILSQHMWKACKLLSQVKHVPTMCCSKFRSTCVAHLEATR